MNQRKGQIPGEAMVGATPIAAVALILWNDFWLRTRYPGFWSGKLSDIGICLLLPVFVSALWEWLTWVVLRVQHRSWRPPQLAVHVAICLLCCAYYSAMELWPAFGMIHQRWLTMVVPFCRFRPGTPDPTDLLALVMTPLSLLYLRRRVARARASADGDPA